MASQDESTPGAGPRIEPRPCVIGGSRRAACCRASCRHG